MNPFKTLKQLVWRPDSQVKELLTGSLTAFILKVSATILVLGMNAYLTRQLGAEQTGIFFLALTLISIATITSRLGMDDAMVRTIASRAGKHKWAEVAGVFQQGLRLVFTGTIIFIGLIWILAAPLAEKVFHKPDLAPVLQTLKFMILPVAFIMLIGESFRGLKKIAQAITIQQLIHPLFIIGSLILFGGLSTLSDFSHLFVFSTSLTAIIAFAFWNLNNRHIRYKEQTMKMTELLKICRPLLLITIMNLVLLWTGTIIVGIYSNSADVGIYNIATRIARLTNFMLISINTIAAPKFAELYYENQQETLKNTAINVTRLMILVTLPLLMVFMFFPTNIMAVFGEQFASGGHILRILAIGQFINVFSGSVSFLLIMSSNEKLLRNNIVFVAVFNVVISLLLVPRYGMTGAAIASSLSMLIQNIVSLILIRMKLKFWNIPFTR